MTGSKAPTFEVLPGGNWQAEMSDQERRRQAQDKLILWRLAQDEGITEDMLRASGNTREQLQQFISHNETLYQDYFCQRFLAEVISLEDMFEIGRMRLAEMLVTVEKPSELKTLISTLALLPGGKALLAAAGKDEKAKPQPAVETHTATADEAPPVADTASESPAPVAEAADSEADPAAQSTAEAAADSTQHSDPAGELLLLQAKLANAGISRQQRRQLERRIDKLREAAEATDSLQGG